MREVMTLCVSWIRQADNSEELIFATDSTLTGGERWPNGIKLFELPRKDCLLSFAGSTFRAYPLVLNLVSSIQFDKHLESPSTNISEVLNYISEQFTSLIKTIVKEVEGEDIHDLRGSAKFLFGGWDWQEGVFRLWNLYYSKDAQGFLFDELTNDDSKTRFYTFLGDAQIDIEKEANDRFKKLLLDEERMDLKLDMEPLTILREIALDKSIREVGGSLQIAKVYKSNRTEFFGILWPSSDGKPHFQGREYLPMNKPAVRYLNPDTFEIMDLDLPQSLNEIAEEIYGNDVDFLNECYPKGNLKDNLAEKDKQSLKSIFKEVSYQKFIKNSQQEIEEENLL